MGDGFYPPLTRPLPPPPRPPGRPSPLSESAMESDAVARADDMVTGCPLSPEESAETGHKMPLPQGPVSTTPCRKCGATKGWAGPRYEGYGVALGQVEPLGGWLVYTCQNCGYEGRWRTKDADEAVREPGEPTETGQNMAPLHRIETTIPCLKCGEAKGWTGPQYDASLFAIPGQVPQVFNEHLIYGCLACGYERREPTKDTVPPTPADGSRGRTSRPVPERVPVPAFNDEDGSLPTISKGDRASAWLILATACGLGWYLFFVQTIARMYPS